MLNFLKRQLNYYTKYANTTIADTIISENNIGDEESNINKYQNYLDYKQYINNKPRDFNNLLNKSIYSDNLNKTLTNRNKTLNNFKNFNEGIKTNINKYNINKPKNNVV